VLRKGHILAILVIGISVTTVLSIQAQQDYSIPQWVKNNALWWGQGDISDADFVSGIKFLIDEKHLQVSTTQDDGWKAEADKLYRENQRLEEENQWLNEKLDEYFGWYEEEFERNQDLQEEYDKLYDSYLYYYNLRSSSSSGNSYYDEPSEVYSSNDCSGNAGCISGYVTDIVDGDTIKVDGQSIRFALVNTPEYGEAGYDQATKFIGAICPRGSAVLVDEDDGQTQRSYGRIIAVVYCNNINLNQAVLEQGFAEISTRFCATSEFASESWAQNYGCAYEEPEYEPPTYEEPEYESSPTTQNCDPSYPDFCIPPPPPDLDCGDISQKRFTVLQPDPHRFDGDKDGIGCES